MTPDPLYAALDCENADIDLILGQIADWYEERGDCWRAECLQWCRREGKRPEKCGSSYRWWRVVPPIEATVGSRLGCTAYKEPWPVSLAEAYENLAGAWHALRERGEEPVAGIDSERMVTT